MSSFYAIFTDWKQFFAIRKNVLLFVLAMGWAIALFLLFHPFFDYIQQRDGHHINDWLLSRIPSLDFNWSIFVLIYSVTLVAVVYLLYHPELFTRALLAYGIVTTMRLLMIYLFPLEPPRGMIVLKDPFFFYVVQPKNIITKDLFFSGHTSTLVLFSLVMDIRWVKYVFIGCTVVLGCLILIQHVHYTYDVVLAPFFTYYSYRLAFYKRKPGE